MKEVGTLKELDVKPGDVVENMKSRIRYTITDSMYVGRVMVKRSTDPYELISRANTPKLWCDMTDAEKGALLLARHDGKVIQDNAYGGMWTRCNNPSWHNEYSYRVRPEPKVETVKLKGGNIPYGYIVTFNTIDGKPDTASIKMEAI